MKNLAKILFDLNVPGANPAFLWRETIISRQQVIDTSIKIADYYKTLGFISASRIILMLPDSPAFVFHFLGLILAKLVPVPVSPTVSINELNGIINDSEAYIIVTTPTCFQKIAANFPAVAKRVLVQTELEAKKLPSTAHLNLPTLHDENSFFEPDSIAFWQYTSGSTGRPKAVLHYHTSALRACDAYARQTLGITQKDRIFSIAKMSFGYGLGNSLLFPFQIGATSILIDEFCITPVVQRVLRLHRPSILFGAPSFYARLLREYQSGTTFDLKSLKFCVSAGEALPPSVQELWQNYFHLPIIDGLGSTELLHVALSNKLSSITAGSLGRPIPTCKARLVNQNGHEVGEGLQGLLEIQAPFKMHGYWNKRKKSKKKSRGGWIRTEDICRKDTKGLYWYCGRANEIFKVKGLWISLIEIENSLLSNSNVADVVVAGRCNKDGLMTLVATVVPTKWPPSKKLDEQLKSYLKSRLSSHKCPSCFQFVRELPRTVTGKKLRPKN